MGDADCANADRWYSRLLKQNTPKRWLKKKKKKVLIGWTFDIASIK